MKKKDDEEVFLDRGPDLPSSYGEDRLELMIRGPRELFLQWELDGERSRSDRASLGEARFLDRHWVVRIIGDTTADRFDLPVDPRTGKLYFGVNAGGVYSARIGVLGADHRLDIYARTGPLETALPAKAPFSGHGTSRPEGCEKDRPGVPGSPAWGPVSPSSWTHFEQE